MKKILCILGLSLSITSIAFAGWTDSINSTNTKVDGTQDKYTSTAKLIAPEHTQSVNSTVDTTQDTVNKVMSTNSTSISDSAKKSTKSAVSDTLDSIW